MLFWSPGTYILLSRLHQYAYVGAIIVHPTLILVWPALSSTCASCVASGGPLHSSEFITKILERVSEEFLHLYFPSVAGLMERRKRM